MKKTTLRNDFIAVLLIVIICGCKINSDRQSSNVNAGELSNEKPLVGTIEAYIGDATTIDDNWVACDGRSLAIDSYLKLFKVIGWRFGFGDDTTNFTTFAIPDFRGSFIRGVDMGSGHDQLADARIIQFDGKGIAMGDLPGSEAGFWDIPSANFNPPLDSSLSLISTVPGLQDPGLGGPPGGYPIHPERTRNISAIWILRAK